MFAICYMFGLAIHLGALFLLLVLFIWGGTTVKAANISQSKYPPISTMHKVMLITDNLFAVIVNHITMFAQTTHLQNK